MTIPNCVVSNNVDITLHIHFALVADKIPTLHSAMHIQAHTSQSSFQCFLTHTTRTKQRDASQEIRKCIPMPVINRDISYSGIRARKYEGRSASAVL